jgi:hypothetical protein
VHLSKYRAIWLVATGLALLATNARASIIFNLNQDGCSGGCGTNPFATVTLTQLDPNTVLVTETLLHGDGFVQTGAGDALEFNLLNNPKITISDLTPAFSIGPAPDTASAFGAFDYSITCNPGCGKGGSHPNPGPLSFEVTLADGGNLSIGNFIANTHGYYFSSDIMGTNGGTGNVASLGGPSSNTPEPASALLLLSGSGLLLFLRKRRHA